jgi:protein-tyrosine kinase
MVARKPGHLVERAAERLLHSGVLESSAAHLLASDRPVARPSDLQPGAEPAAWPAAGSLAPDPPDGENLEPQVQPSGASGALIDVLALKRAGMFDWSLGRSRTSEEFRLAQRQILRTAFARTAYAPGAEHAITNLVLLTSARAGEGKSFTALNLAGSVALQGDHQVLLIDGDSKRASMCEALGVADALGVLDLAANPSLDPSDMILRTEIENLWVLPIGRERRRSSELFASRDMTGLIQRLARRYSERLLVLDSSPCLSTSDPAALAPIVGQIVFVVEAERTQREEVEAALDLIQACPHIMLLLNKVQVTNRYTFGAYSDYYSS